MLAGNVIFLSLYMPLDVSMKSALNYVLIISMTVNILLVVELVSPKKMNPTSKVVSIVTQKPWQKK